MNWTILNNLNLLKKKSVIIFNVLYHDKWNTPNTNLVGKDHHSVANKRILIPCLLHIKLWIIFMCLWKYHYKHTVILCNVWKINKWRKTSAPFISPFFFWTWTESNKLPNIQILHCVHLINQVKRAVMKFNNQPRKLHYSVENERKMV